MLFASPRLCARAPPSRHSANCHKDRGGELRAAVGMWGWAQAAGLPDTTIRWMSEDCLTFVEREVKRGNKYDALIFDPPAFGRGGKGKSSKTWKLDQDLPKLLKLFPDLLSDQAAFVVLSCHDPKWSSQRLAEALRAALPPAAGGAHHIDHGPMIIEASCEGGRPLPMGIFARWRSPALRPD